MLSSHFVYPTNPSSPNYFGDASDGILTTSGNVNHTVTQIGSSSYDGEMVVKQYENLNIVSGHTMTTNQPCRGMLIYVSGNCSIAGTLTMTARGGAANPTSSTASSDSATVPAGGLQLGMFTSGGSSSHTNSLTSFSGFGNAACTAFNNQGDPASNGTVYTLARTGGAAIRTTGAGNQDGATGTAGGYSGGTWTTGAGGAGGHGSITGGNGPYSGAGGAFGGGSGATGLRISATATGVAADQSYGNAGVTAGSGNSGSQCSTGGAGNPGGAGADSGQTGASGTGGILILIVGGELLISGTISANGMGQVSANGITSNCAIGGASGGGAVMVLHRGTYTDSSATVQALGGAASTASAFGDGGAGGVGGAQIIQIL